MSDNYRETLQERAARINRDGAKLKEEFQKRLQQLEHEHVIRLLALFQEFKARSSAIAGHRVKNDNSNVVVEMEKDHV
jgi:hypothetical protein